MPIPHTYEYPRAALTVDCVVFGLDEQELKVLLIQRALAPFEGKWALPGGFVRLDGDARRSRAARARGGDRPPQRLPRAALHLRRRRPRPARARRLGRLLRAGQLARPQRARRHRRAATRPGSAFTTCRASPSITRTSCRRRSSGCAASCAISRSASSCCRRSSRSRSSSACTSSCSNETLDKRNFRKRVLAMDLLVELDEVEQDVAHRAARLYRFDERKYKRLAKQGFNFEL